MMLRKNMFYSMVFITVLTLIIGCSGSTTEQKPEPEPISVSNLLRMFFDQPDHRADRTIVVNDSVVKMKFAKKQDRTRHEFYPLDQSDSLKNESYRYYKIIMIINSNNSAMAFDPQEKTYADAPDDSALIPFDIEAFLKNLAAELKRTRVENIGTESINGYEASKIRVKFEDEAEEMYFYLAKDMKNLILKMESGSIKQIKVSYTVSNVSLDVEEELFEMPDGYKKVDFNTMISTIKRKALK